MSQDDNRTVPDGDDERSVSRRRALQVATAGGLLGGGLFGPSAVPGAVGRAAADDHETTAGETEPAYDRLPPEEVYVETEYESADGATETPAIYGEVIRPDVPAGRDVPVILTYSPYNYIGDDGGSIADDRVADYYVPRGYARAVFDVVGTRNSGGCFDNGGVRERKTAAQVVEALGAMEWSNGKVGMVGISWNGTTPLAAALEDPDHLATIVPQAGLSRWYNYFYDGGIRYFLDGSNYFSLFQVAGPAAYDTGLAMPPPNNVDDPDRWAAAMEDRYRPCDTVKRQHESYQPNPVYNDYWRRRDYERRADEVTASVFLEVGWRDGNVVPWNSTRFFQALPDDHPKKLSAGMWGHGSSEFADADDVRHAWFDYWLYDIDTGVMDLPRVDSGLNTGRRTQQSDWPPRTTARHRLGLVRSRPAAAGALDALALAEPGEPVYVESDPPLTEPEMFAGENRGNHLTFRSAPLDRDVRISGRPRLDVHARSATDSTHYTPVMYDRGPDGAVDIITRGFLNARNRNGLDCSEPVPTDEPYHVPVDLWDVDWVVQSGHRLGVVVASENAEWAVNDHGNPNRNRILLSDDPCEPSSRLVVPVSEGGR
jgi:X-Pro dipeptidyl-peptidase